MATYKKRAGTNLTASINVNYDCKEIIKKHGRNNLEETFLKLARSRDELQ